MPRAKSRPAPAPATADALEQLLRAIANDPEAGAWSSWARKLLRGDPPKKPKRAK